MRATVVIWIFAGALALLWSSPALAVPPANDDFPGTTFTVAPGTPYTNSVDTTDATLQAGEPSAPPACGGITIGATVWYNFTPATSGSIVVDTIGSNYDTVLAAYTGASLATLSPPIACNDDFVGLQSQLMIGVSEVAVSEGTTYNFQAGGFFGATGSLTFNAVLVTVNGPVTIDIKPGGSPNSINPGSRGVIPMAILTTGDFNAATVNAITISFAGASATTQALEDVDGDGDQDLIMHFRTQDTNIQAGDTQACLTGQTVGATSVEGCDSVRTVPPNTDSDGEGFTDDVEATLATPQFTTCSKSGKYLAWPPDLNADRLVNFQDLNGMVPLLFSQPPGPPYNIRFDVFEPGMIINFQDLNTVLPHLFRSCS